MSHDTAKRYYDRYTNVEQFKKEDYVYVQYPVHKRGKAKKLSYQYDGPFEVEQKISPLIYKIRLGDGTSTILHVNRLKRMHKQNSGNGVLPEVKLEKYVKITQPGKSSCGRRENHVNKRALEEVVPPPAALVKVQEEKENEEDVDELLGQNSGDPEWVPRSSYLQRK